MPKTETTPKREKKEKRGHHTNAQGGSLNKSIVNGERGGVDAYRFDSRGLGCERWGASVKYHKSARESAEAKFSDASRSLERPILWTMKG